MSQNPAEGRSWLISTLASAVASGSNPSTTPPWEAGTVCMAMAENTGNPSTTPAATTARPASSGRVGHGARVTASRTTATSAATTARPRPMNTGSMTDTTSEVMGRVRPKATTPPVPHR
ncbi:MAG: hypothetical protein M5U09_04865 [Gammaproteobacteria bacterium]|nr:hypothetical protein [Gammaproteobacteria bacterium]